MKSALISACETIESFNTFNKLHWPEFNGYSFENWKTYLSRLPVEYIGVDCTPYYRDNSNFTLIPVGGNRPYYRFSSKSELVDYLKKFGEIPSPGQLRKLWNLITRREHRMRLRDVPKIYRKAV